MDVDSLLSNTVETSRRAVRGSASESLDDDLGGLWDEDGIVGWRARRARAMRSHDAAPPASDDWALPDDSSTTVSRALAAGSPRLSSRLELPMDSPLRRPRQFSRQGASPETSRSGLERPATLLRPDQTRRSPPRRSPGPQETRDTARAASREAAQPYRGFASESRFTTDDPASGSLNGFGRALRDAGYTSPLHRFGDPEPLSSSRLREERRQILRNLETEQADINAQRRRLQALQARIGAQIDSYYSRPDLGDFDQLPIRPRPGIGSRPLPSSNPGSFGAFSSRNPLLYEETERLVDQMMRSPRPSIFETAQEIIYRQDRRRGQSGVASAMCVVECKAHAELEGDVDVCCAVCHDEVGSYDGPS